MGPLLFHEQDLDRVARGFCQGNRVEWKDQRDLVNADTMSPGVLIADPERFQCRNDVGEGFARSRDYKARCARPVDDPVETVGPGE